MAFPDAGSSASQVCAVIVTFNPDGPQFQELFDALRPQVERIVIVDNASKEATREMLARCRAFPGVELVELEANRGIAVAHNVGIRHAQRTGAVYVMLLDHDSTPAVDMVARLVEAHRTLSRSGAAVAAVGPLSIDRRTGKRASFVRRHGIFFERITCNGDEACLEVDFLISSGTLIALGTFERVGFMQERLFIDHVDTDWCFRAQALGLRMFAICGAHLFHSLGDDIRRAWFLRWRDVHVHSTLRDYYMFRNTVLMLRSTPMPLPWRLRLTNRLVMFVVFSLAFLPSRGERISRMMSGLWDGLRNKSGSR
jgi:rhamnosyltransferase